MQEAQPGNEGSYEEPPIAVSLAFLQLTLDNTTLRQSWAQSSYAISEIPDPLKRLCAPEKG